MAFLPRLSLMSHFGTSNLADKMGLRYAPYVLTEQGIAMLSSIGSISTLKHFIKPDKVFSYPQMSATSLL
jgi:hypothetical protein